MGSELVVNMEANQVILAPPNNDLDNKSALSEKGIMIYYQTTVREIYNNIIIYYQSSVRERYRAATGCAMYAMCASALNFLEIVR